MNRENIFYDVIRDHVIKYRAIRKYINWVEPPYVTKEVMSVEIDN